MLLLCNQKIFKFVRSEENKRQGRKGKIHPSECRVPGNIKER